MIDLLRPAEHWGGTVEPLLRAVAPRAVWVPGDDGLSGRVKSFAQELGYELNALPTDRTDAVVLSGEPNYHWVTGCLTQACAPGVGGSYGSPVVVISGTGWPHGDRDGYRAPESMPASERHPYAHRLPDPDEVWLTAEPAAFAYALESGGERNGVRPAVAAVASDDSWRALFFEGFGGLAVLAPLARLSANDRLAAATGDPAADPAAQALLRELDLTLGRAAIAHARLERELTDRHAAAADLQASLENRIEELELGVGEENRILEGLAPAITRLGAAMSARKRREQRLEARLSAAEALADAARTELTDERLWVATQARSVAHSQAWRVGHRLSRALRLLTLRRDRGTDAVQRIVTRMERGLGAEKQ